MLAMPMGVRFGGGPLHRAVGGVRTPGRLSTADGASARAGRTWRR
jgi:hypothetical protein